MDWFVYKPQSNTADSEVKPRRDAAILRSMPGVGPGVLSTMLSEAAEAIRNRDLSALRCLCGVARVAVQKDPTCKKKNQELLQRGHRHARALRSVADRLLSVACALLNAQTEFNPQHPVKASQCV